MKLIFLGTGDAFCEGGRANTSILIDSDPRILLDCSPQAVYNLRRGGYKVSDVEYILISHLHGDHAGGLPFIILTLRFREQGRIVVLGPSGTRAFVEMVYGVYYGMDDVSSIMEFRPFGGSLPFELAHMRADHPVEAYMYRIGIGGRSIVYTGDTGKLDLSKFAEGADVLIHEASETDEGKARTYGHSTPLQAATAAAEAQVGRLVLVHRPKLDEETLLQVRRRFPNTIVPDDMDVIGL